MIWAMVKTRAEVLGTPAALFVLAVGVGWWLEAANHPGGVARYVADRRLERELSRIAERCREAERDD